MPRKPLTMQKVFDKVATHMLRQRRRSVDWVRDGCAYFGSRRRRCAIGCLLPFRLKNRAIEEGWNTGGVDEIPYDVLADLGLSDVLHNQHGFATPLATELQQVHDTGSPEAWPRELKSIGQRYDLELPPALKKALENS